VDCVSRTREVVAAVLSFESSISFQREAKAASEQNI
jgi:hypothetical protein